jgi:hypothetical protein
VRDLGKLLALGSCACALAAAGCGSSGGSSGSGSASPGTSSTPATAGAGALSAEVRSAATGDIPDNQVFLVFSNPSARYSMKYPEGWTQSGSGNDVTFRNKNNIVHISIAAGPAPTPASLTSSLQALKASTPSLSFTAPAPASIGSEPALKLTYATHSAPDPVTGRSVELIVDRYALHHAGRVAIVDLGTPQGVDNVDAYRMMIQSFRWT